jgi:hypothetical protein
VSSTVESALGCSPDDTFRVEVVGKLVAEFYRLEGRCSWLEQPTASICNLLHGPLPGWAQLADHLDEATGQLRAERLHGRKWMLSWRSCGLWLCEFGTWC